MALVYETMRRLDVRGPASRGIVVDAEGAMLGPDCTLVRRTTAGYRCVRPEAAAAIQKAVFDAREDDPDRLFVLSRGIAKALNDGELALAQIYGLRIPVAGLDSSQLRKLVAAAPWIKANFNPDEPRIPAGEPGAGEWTYGGDDEGNEEANGAEPRTPPSGRAPAPVAVGTTTAVAATDETAGSVFGTISRTALAALGELAADMAGPAAFLGVLFLPTNSSLISEGTVPSRPDLSYRYDQDTGVLDLFRQDDAGQQLVASGHIGIDGLFHDAAGDVIGRGLGSTVLVDPDALPAPVGRTGVEAQTAQDRPQLCPDPSDENIAGRSERAIAYQSQITGLPPGLAVKLSGVGFDGCRESDGTMLEAKGPGYATFLDGQGG
jgi:Restriction endonuclease fold toxin 5